MYILYVVAFTAASHSLPPIMPANETGALVLQTWPIGPWGSQKPHWQLTSLLFYESSFFRISIPRQRESQVQARLSPRHLAKYWYKPFNFLSCASSSASSSPSSSPSWSWSWSSSWLSPLLPAISSPRSLLRKHQMLFEPLDFLCVPVVLFLSSRHASQEQGIFSKELSQNYSFPANIAVCSASCRVKHVPLTAPLYI